MTTITPISQAQQQEVIACTERYLRQACACFDLDYIDIPVSFDLRGRAAGMYQFRQAKPLIRYNPWIFAKYYIENLNQTVPHEVAHYITHCLFGVRGIRPHGKQWKMVMRALGVQPRVHAEFDLTGIPLRQQRQHRYRCACREHQLSSTRHNKLARNQASYHCRRCGDKLVYVQQAAHDSFAIAQ